MSKTNLIGWECFIQNDLKWCKFWLYTSVHVYLFGWHLMSDGLLKFGGFLLGLLPKTDFLIWVKTLYLGHLLGSKTQFNKTIFMIMIKTSWIVSVIFTTLSLYIVIYLGLLFNSTTCIIMLQLKDLIKSHNYLHSIW